MNYMFGKCSLLKKLDISNLSSNHMIKMDLMLFECLSPKELNIFNIINNKSNINLIFSKCYSLKEINIF